MISRGANERGGVLFDALMSGTDIPPEQGATMIAAVARHGPAMPPETLVNLVLQNVRDVAGNGGDRAIVRDSTGMSRRTALCCT